MRGAVDTPQPERRRSPEWSLSPLEQLIDEETRIAVEAQDKGKGYEHAKGSYLMIEDHELEAIEIESNHTIEIDRSCLAPRSTNALPTEVKPFM